MRAIVLQSILLLATTLAWNSAGAQTGIGTIAPDPTVALHVKAQPGQDVALFENARISATDTNVIVMDINGKLKYRSVQSLINANSEWRYRPATQQIYAFRAKNVANTDIVITDSGRIGIGQTNPLAGLHLFNRGLITGNANLSNPGLYDTREQIRIASGSGDAMIVVQDGTGRLNIKWNSSYGTGQFLASGDYASRILLHGDPTPGAQIFDVMQSSVGGTAGNNISWQSRFRITNDGGVQVNPSHGATGLLDVSSQTRLRNLPTGLVSDDPFSTDRLVVATAATGHLRQVHPDVFFRDVGEWANHASNTYIYARRAKVNAPFQDVVVSVDGGIGLGLTNPTDKLQIRGGGMVIDGPNGIGFGRETSGPGVGTRDGARMYTDVNAFGSSRDALVIEKTDVNHVTVDGGILFTTRGSNANRDDRMAIRGDGKVGINTLNPLDLFHVYGNGLFQTGGVGAAATGGMVRTGDNYTNPVGWATNGFQSSDAGDYTLFGTRTKTASQADGVVLFGRDNNADFKIIHANSGIETELAHFDGATKNLGIGISTPDANTKLDVNGRVRVRQLDLGDVNNVGVDDQLVTADANGVLRKVPAASLFQDFQDDDWVILTNGNIYNKNSGNVGIGTAAPTFKLDVNGSMRLGLFQTMQFGNNANNALSVVSDNDLVFRNNSRLRFQNRTGTQDLLIVDGGVGSVGVGTTAPNNTYGMDFATHARFRENQRLYFGNQNSNGSQNYLYNLNDNTFRLRAQTLFAIRNSADGADVLAVRSDQSRVGIKTDAPTTELDVDGAVRIRNLPNGVAADLLVSTDVNGNLRKIPQTVFDGPWIRDAANARTTLRNDGDRVGIGTTNPLGKLHIYETPGTIMTANSGSLLIEHSDNGGESSIVFRSAVNRGSDFGYIQYKDDGSLNGTSAENSLLEIGVQNDGIGGSQDDIAIMPTGYLGINTRRPARMLHVEGDARITNLPLVNNTTDFAITVDNAGDLRKQALTSIRDNLGNHIATQNLRMGNFFLSNNGTNQGLQITANGSMIGTNRLQLGNASSAVWNDAIAGYTNGFFRQRLRHLHPCLPQWHRRERSAALHPGQCHRCLQHLG